ncbi:MFS transporter [Planomonospora venezuelensis]|uniref:Fucose permease n=1 Tax=Planomonospora venezuelensis TaxID=1999 RepID=A0A841DFG5_PLAVE|nr:MFS transporter [Planomonospora venezuelensis]MBB5967048.1 fucose permease [Planomonospora venezuelensis]
MHGRWRVSVALAYAVFVLVGMSAGVGGVLLPAQIDDYGVDKTTIGITFFTFSAGFMLAGATAGSLVDRLGTRAALVAGGGAFVLAGLYTATRPPFVALVAVQVMAGYGTGVLESVLNAHLTRLPSATTLLNHLHAFFGVGALLGPLLAAWMLGFLPWTAVWLVLAVLCLPLTAGFLMAYPGSGAAAGRAEGKEPQSGVPAALDEPGGTSDGPGGASEKPGKGLLAAALRMPGVLLASVFLAVYVGLEIGVGNWGFSFMVEEYEQPDLAAGYTVSGYWLGLTLGRFLISPVAARLGLTATGMAFVCLFGVTASAALTWMAPVAMVAAAGFALLGFFLGPLFPTAMVVVPRLTAPRLVPTAIGVMNGVSVIGGSAFPWLAGAVAQGVGVWTLMPFALTLALLQLVIWRLLVTRMTAEEDAPAPSLG